MTTQLDRQSLQTLIPNQFRSEVRLKPENKTSKTALTKKNRVEHIFAQSFQQNKVNSNCKNIDM